MSSFYANSLSIIEGDVFNFFCSYISYLIFEVNNYVSSLIYIYNYIYSISYKRNGSILRDSRLANFINMSSSLLNTTFLNSNYWLSEKRVHDIYAFNTDLMALKNMLIELVNEQCNYFYEITRDVVDTKNLSMTSKKVLKLRSGIDRKFRQLFSINVHSVKLNRYYILYQRNIYFKTVTELSENYGRINFLKKKAFFAHTL